MYTQNQFSCFIIGEGTLPIQCAELLLERGHEILGVISSDASISSWAKRKDIPHILQTDNLVAFLSQQPFDYLFSIVNNSVLPEEILELPRQLAINYHDALLPRYAGVNATSWALMHGEKTHGVTWHVMTAMVDAGNTLQQISVEINSDETTFTLNGKCYEAAICSFAQLIDDLSSGQALGRKPNLDERTYFGRYKRPRAGGVLSFNSCAHDIDAFVRALDFGPYPNPLGLPKLVIGNNSIIVSKLEVLSDQPKSLPGTIIAIESSFLKVSTASYSVALHQVLTIGGQVLPIPDLVARFGLHVGYRFKDIEPDRVKRIERFDALMAKHEAFWVERLRTLQHITIPYAQRTVSHLKSKQYASVEIPISHEITTFLEKRYPACNLGEFLEAAFTTYLARIGGTECFDIGFRDVKLQQEMVGLENLFASHVPCRVNIGYEQSFEEVFEAFKKQVELTKLHLTYGRDVVRRYPALRLLSQTDCEQMFPVVVERVEKLDNYQVEPGNELTLVIASDGKECFWFYNTSAFDGDSITRMQDQFAIFLLGIVTDPARCVAEIPLLSEQERHKILMDWNDTQVDYPKDKCIHQLFEAQVEQTPDAVAVFFEDEQLTYKELNQRANQLAYHLRNLGVGPEVLVGICVERSLEMVVGLLGILKAGGAYVPLDPAYPPERLAFMLEDASVGVLLTQARLVESLPKHQGLIVCLDTDWEIIERQSEENPGCSFTPENLAYVIYTSGSTGKPKGVLVAHSGLSNLATAQIRIFNVQPNSRVLQFASLSFDASVSEVVMALLAGATLVMGTRDSLLPGATLIKLLRDFAIATVTLPPSVLAVLPANELPTLRTIIVAGEACSRDLIAKWSSGRRFFNAYGPTESTVCATIAECTDSKEPPPIGRPIANTQAYILDAQLQLVPIGVPGELYLGGAGLARGYLNRPELTAYRFIPNPFSNELSSRLYKTGDLARYLSDGNIEFLGRIDQQVKIRGFRIELGEIEAVLSQHPDVRESAVIGREDVPGHKYLVAYIVPNHESVMASSDLRGFLKQKLPDYMIPGVFVVLDALALTPNGKVDRRALPAPEFQPELQQSLLAPRTPIEEMLTSIWADVLRIELVGVHHNFFELGGHSLLATQVISRVRDTLGVELPLRSLFETPTIAQLASWVELELKNGQPQEAEPLLPIPRLESIPLSFAQARLWFLDQLQPNSAFYNIPLALRLSGQLNIVAIESSINEIIQRHEALRTNFTTQEGQPVQIIASTLNLKLLVVDLLYLPESSREIEAQRLAFEEANRPFNLEREPLVRGTALQLGETEYILVLTMHHIISDGWSLGVFVRELTELYKAFCTGSPPVLPVLPVQYADFAVWQRQWFSGEILKTQLHYWKEQLKNAPNLLELPTDRPRRAVQTFQGGYYYAAFDKELSAKLTALSKRWGVTLFMTLVAAFQTLLYRLSGEDDIVVGTPVAGRNRREIEGLIGFFVNTLLLRTNLEGDPSFEELLGRVREVALQAYTHQDLPFEQLVQTLQPTRDLSYTPLFQVMFALDDALVPSVKLAELTVSSYFVELGTAKFDLTLSMENTTDGLAGVWEYNADLFDKTTIARMARHFQTLVEAIVANPQQKVSSLPLLTEQERHQLLVDWNNTTKEYPSDKCIHQLFEEQVERSPDAEAVLFEDKQLTYRELNQRANSLAHHLRTLGVGPEVLVGICVERSLEMVVGLLGILKAGGAYVPLDPAYPPERLAFMLEDASVGVLLTQARLVESLPKHQGPIVCLDTDWEIIERQSEENPGCSLTPENLAYVIYTSGSTGKPKGVLVAHSGVSNLATALIRISNVQPNTRVLQFCSLSFDGSVTELVMALLSGATMVMGTRDSLLPGANLIQLLRNFEVTTVALLPSVLAVLPVNELPALRTIIAAGEACSRELVAKWSSGRRFFNGYGPTECTVCTTIVECSDSTQAPPIGRPLPNTQVYILDAQKQLVPIGVPGELYIGGVGVTRGYLNRPEITADRFILNPFSNDLGSRLYKTGDLVRYLSDGNIEFLGRIDHQVKIRGFRIELGEIEAVLRQNPAVQDAVVIGQEYDLHDKRLVAYVVPSQEQVLSTSELRSYLKQKLPDHMVPSAFVRLEALPLTPNDKVDRRALPMPDGTRSLEETFAPPLTLFEEVLANIWSEVLRLDSVGIHDNFFELGGHSLLAVRLLAQIEKTFGKNLPLSTLFQSPTIEQLANILRQKGGSAPCQTLVVIQSAGSKRPLFFIHVLGEGLKFCRSLASHLDPEQPIYGLAVGIMDEVSVNKIEDVVAYYIKEMRSIQPEGPYLLAGIYCGGRIAYEMAQQLHEQGQKVALVALLDTLKDGEAVKIIPVQKRVLAHWKNFLRIGPTYLLSKRRLGEAKKRLMSIYCQFYERLGLPSPQACQSFTYRKKKEEGMEWVFAPKQVYPDRVTLFRPIDNIGFIDPDLGWSELAPGGLEIHDVPGDTFSMLEEPQVQGLAEKLRDCINRVQGDDLAHIPPLCSNPFVCDNEDSEGYHIQTRSGLT
jgi:amino acid adenylation domain-containing protein